MATENEGLFQSVEAYLDGMSPKRSKTTSKKSPKTNLGLNEETSPRANFEPRRLPASITTLHVQTLNGLCSQCPYVPPAVAVIGSNTRSSTAWNGRELGALQPVWDILKDSQITDCWKAKLKLFRKFTDAPNTEEFVESDGLVEAEFGDEKPYPSKKHAKEAVAKLAVEWLKPEIEVRRAKLGKTGPCRPAIKGKSNDSGFGQLNDGYGNIVSEPDGTNWVGMLNEYAIQKRIELPEYIPYETLGKTFSCEVRLASIQIHNPIIPISPGELDNLTFGDIKIRYTTKKLARMGAAKHAIEWLQRRDPFLAQAGSNSKKSKGKDSNENSKTIKVSKHMGPRISHKLGLRTPKYKLDPGANPNNALYNAEIFIERPYGETDVLIGPVKNILGKEKAKTEVAKLGIEFMKQEAKKLGYTIVGLEEDDAIDDNAIDDDAIDDAAIDDAVDDNSIGNTIDSANVTKEVVEDNGGFQVTQQSPTTARPRAFPNSYRKPARLLSIHGRESESDEDVWEDAPDDTRTSMQAARTLTANANVTTASVRDTRLRSVVSARRTDIQG